MVRRYLVLPSAPAGLRTTSPPAEQPPSRIPLPTCSAPVGIRATSPPAEQSPSRIPRPVRRTATDEPHKPDTSKSEAVRAAQTSTSALLSEAAAEIHLRGLFFDVKDFPPTEFCRFEALSNHVCRRGFCRSTTRDQITRMEYVELSDAMKANMAASEARAEVLRARKESEVCVKGEKEIPKSLTGIMSPLETTSFSGSAGVSMRVRTGANRNMLSNPSPSKGPSLSVSVEFDTYKPIRPLNPTPKPTVPNQPFALQSGLDRPQAELVRTMNMQESATPVVKTPNGWLEEDPSLIPATLHLYNEDGSRVGPHSVWSPARVSPGYQFAPSFGEWKCPQVSESHDDSFLASARALGHDATTAWLEDWMAATCTAPDPELSMSEKCDLFDWIAADLLSRGAYIEALQSGHEHFAPRCYPGEAACPMDWMYFDRRISNPKPYLDSWETCLFQVGVDVESSHASTVAKGKRKADAVDLRNEEMAQLRGHLPEFCGAALSRGVKTQWELIEESVVRHPRNDRLLLEPSAKRRAAEAVGKLSVERERIANLPPQPQELASLIPQAAIDTQEPQDVQTGTRARPFSTTQPALDLLTREFVLKSPQEADQNSTQYTQSADTALANEDAFARAKQTKQDPPSGYSRFTYQFHSTVHDALRPEEEAVWQECWESCFEEPKTVAKPLSTMKHDLELGLGKIALETARRAVRARMAASSTQSPRLSHSTHEATYPAPSQTPWKRKLVKFADEVDATDTAPKYPFPLSERQATTYIPIIVAILVTPFCAVLMVWAIAEMLCASLHGVLSAIKQQAPNAAALLPERYVLPKKLRSYIRIALISSALIGTMALAFASGFATRDYLSTAAESGTLVVIPPAPSEALPSTLPSALPNGPLIRILSALGLVLLARRFFTPFSRVLPSPLSCKQKPPLSHHPSRLIPISPLTAAALILPTLFLATTPKTSRLPGIASHGIDILSQHIRDLVDVVVFAYVGSVLGARALSTRPPRGQTATATQRSIPRRALYAIGAFLLSIASYAVVAGCMLKMTR